MENTRSCFDEYIEHSIRIRALSTPSLEGVTDAASYRGILRDNFLQIGQLASRNRLLLEERFFPLIKKEETLKEEDTKDLTMLEELLADAKAGENLDLPIAYLASERLLKDAMATGDILPKLRRMDMHISTSYAMMNVTYRISEYPEIAEQYFKAGMDLGEVFLTLREPQNFARLESEEARELVLTNCRFIPAFYEIMTNDRAANDEDLQRLQKSLEIEQDPFYRERMPDFDWQYYRYRVLTYFAMTTDFCNRRGFEKDQFELICDRTEELWDLWHQDPETFGEMEKESSVELLYLRNRYYAGRISAAEYREGLDRIYAGRDKNLYEFNGVLENLQIPLETLGLIHETPLTEQDLEDIKVFFDNVVAYAFHMPNTGSLCFLVELYMHILRYFVEVPGGKTFEELILDLMAALHPPTYVHSKMVAEFSACLGNHLIDREPERLIGVEGCQTAEEVRERREEVLDFIKHAALCHDTGKIAIIDTIIVYGRKLLDMEFGFIKTHPKMGASMLSAHKSTAKYAEVALGHHKWYDNSRGYPETFDIGESSVRAVIDLVECADCLDAATDTIGRSYSKGKFFDDLYLEVREGSGTRYAPWLADLLATEAVRRDVEHLLVAERDKEYLDTYRLLRAVHEKEV